MHCAPVLSVTPDSTLRVTLSLSLSFSLVRAVYTNLARIRVHKDEDQANVMIRRIMDDVSIIIGRTRRSSYEQR